MNPGAVSPGRRVARAGSWLRVAILLMLAWPPLAWGLARFLIVRADLPHADALVVLSGSATYYERSRMAAQLWHSGRAPIIILTNDDEQGGWSRSEQRNPFFYEHEAATLRADGVPQERIEVIPEPVFGTYEEAILLRRYAEKRNLRSLIFVTSAYHSRRALWTLHRVFNGSGIAVGLEPVPTGQQTPSPALWWLHRRAWVWIGGEYVKSIYYWVVV